MVTEKQKGELKELGSEITSLRRQLNNVKNRSGFFNIARLLKLGLIKEKVTKKGELRGGIIVGKKSHWVLTEKGKRIQKAASTIAVLKL